MTKPRFVLVGCGRIGERHAALCRQFGTLVAVADVNATRATTVAARYNCVSYTSFENLLAASSGKADALVVATPNYLHAPQTIAALQAGLHVLCEKPMAIRHTDACQMADAAALAKRHLLVVKQNRFNPPVAQVKEWLQQGLLGEVHFAQCNGFWHRGADYYKNSWRGKKAEDGGTLYTQFSHFIDVLIWFLGPLKPLHVQTQNQQHQGIIETDDCGTVIFQFGKKGILSLQYTVNAAAQNMEGSITLIGTKGTVKIGGQYLNELSYCAGSIEPPAYLPPGNPPNAYGQYTGSMSNHPQVYTQFLQLLQEKWSGQQALQEAIETVKAIEEVYGF